VGQQSEPSALSVHPHAKAPGAPSGEGRRLHGIGGMNSWRGENENVTYLPKNVPVAEQVINIDDYKCSLCDHFKHREWGGGTWWGGRC
jgi:hypothetical protein